MKRRPRIDEAYVKRIEKHLYPVKLSKGKTKRGYSNRRST